MSDKYPDMAVDLFHQWLANENMNNLLLNSISVAEDLENAAKIQLQHIDSLVKRVLDEYAEKRKSYNDSVDKKLACYLQPDIKKNYKKEKNEDEKKEYSSYVWCRWENKEYRGKHHDKNKWRLNRIAKKDSFGGYTEAELRRYNFNRPGEFFKVVLAMEHFLQWARAEYKKMMTILSVAKSLKHRDGMKSYTLPASKVTGAPDHQKALLFETLYSQDIESDPLEVPKTKLFKSFYPVKKKNGQTDKPVEAINPVEAQLNVEEHEDSEDDGRNGF